MNDITALMQRIPERKRHDWSQSVMRDCDFCNQWALTVKHEDGARICASCCDAEYTSKLEVENSALIEALEKAQAVNAAAEKLVRCKGRYHSEQNYRALAALFGVKTPDLPPLESESRTATVKLPPRVDSSNVPFTAHTWNCCLDAVEKCLSAAGIQVIEGEHKNG